MKNVTLIYVDLFCGGGGTTTGVHNARIGGEQCAIVAACINHDENAIRSHKSNHKQTLHFTEDITLLYNTSRMTRLVRHVNYLQFIYPDAKVVLFASLECTNFSKAKGGQARDADSRTLADHLFPYITAIQPEIIQIENVEEFMSWGPLDEKGKPISKDAGIDYLRWINSVKSYGYKFEHRILNAANYGAFTSRKRYFGQFAGLGEEIYWPEPTHAEKPENSLFGKPLKKWKAVKEVLDFSDEGWSIFDRKKPLVEATLQRIYAGLIKFVAGGQKAFLSKAFSGDPKSKSVSVDRPAGTITCKDHHQLINTEFLASYYGNGDNVSSIEKPSPTVTTKDRISLIQTRFIDQQYGQSTPASIDKPIGTLTANPKFAPVVVDRYIMNQYTGGGQSSDVEKPCPAISTVPKQNLMTVKPWVMDTNFNNVGSSIENPAPVITANRKWHYLMNPQFTSSGGSIDRPCFTLIARMDKMPPYLIDVATDESNIPSFIIPYEEGIVYEIIEGDSEILVKIKEFMAIYGIIDIKMRMLRIPELKKIMGFPESYILIGTQADQKKFIGNAVEVHMATALVEATAKGLMNKKIAA